MNTKRNVGIIGGGASGIFLAICLKRFIPEVNITIYEAQNKIGKKILQTGNGKCNLSNLDISSSKYNSDLVDEILSNFSNETLFNILNDMGLKIRIDEEGRVYPYSEKATTVLDIFLKEINKLPKKLKETIVLYEFEDYSYEKIAQKLKIPEGTVKSRINNARKILNCSEEEYKKLEKICEGIDSQKLLVFMQKFSAIEAELKFAMSPKTLIELAALECATYEPLKKN